MFLRTILYSLEQKTMETCLATKNCFLFSVFNNKKKKHGVFIEYLLVVFYCFHLFSDEYQGFRQENNNKNPY